MKGSAPTRKVYIITERVQSMFTSARKCLYTYIGHVLQAKNNDDIVETKTSKAQHI